MRIRTACLVLPVLAGFTLPARGQDVAASPSTITTERQRSSGGDFSEVMYVTNRSTHTVVVTSFRLTDCDNEQGSCGTRRMKHRIAAGERTSIQRVGPRSPDQPFGFSYSFTWEQEAEEGPTAKDVEKDSAALSASSVQGPVPPTKGATRILVQVTP